MKKKLGMLLALVVCVGSGWAHSQKTETATSPDSDHAEFRPSPEMQKLFDVFLGKWKVDENFEIGASHQGQKRRGTASFRRGPGFSLIEDYKSDGSAGRLNFLALLWWDKSVKAYHVFTCANNDGCDLRGIAKWEGNALVNSWQDKASGKVEIYRDSFVDISPSAFRLVSEGTSDGKTIWRVITQYTRLPAETTIKDISNEKR